MDLAASPMNGVLTPGRYDCRPAGASERWLALDGLPPFFKELGRLKVSLSLTRRLAEGWAGDVPSRAWSGEL